MQTITSQSGTVHSVGTGNPGRISGRTPTTCGMNFNNTFPIENSGEPTCRYCVAADDFAEPIKALVGRKIRAANDIIRELRISRTQLDDAVAGSWDLHWRDTVERTEVSVMQQRAASPTRAA